MEHGVQHRRRPPWAVFGIVAVVVFVHLPLAVAAGVLAVVTVPMAGQYFAGTAPLVVQVEVGTYPPLFGVAAIVLIGGAWTGVRAFAAGAPLGTWLGRLLLPIPVLLLPVVLLAYRNGLS